jgi:prepilin-type N-terminal cleavage/methylation domain-containing protein
LTLNNTTKHSRGFTLIELVVIIALLGITELGKHIGSLIRKINKPHALKPKKSLY